MKNTKEGAVVYHNLQEMLDKRISGGCTPMSWGQQIYKVTDCGPWVAYVLSEEPERTDRWEFRIQEDKRTGILKASAEKEDTPESAFRFLGFEPDGTLKTDHVNQAGWRSLQEYARLIDDFIFSDPAPSATRLFQPGFKRCPEGLEVTLKQPVEAKTRDIYYNDAEANSREWIDRCSAIKIGSIVEGSEVEIGPFLLEFPFTGEDLDNMVTKVDEEARFYWERDNQDSGLHL